MGLSSSFFFIQTKDVTKAQLQEALDTQPFLQPRENSYAFGDASAMTLGALLAYQSGAAWCPVLDEGLEGSNDDEGNATELSRAFGVPAFAFGVMDSDILFVTYCDAAQGTVQRWVKGNAPGIVEAYFGPEDPEEWLEEFQEIFGPDVPEKLMASPSHSPQTLPDFMLNFGEPDQLLAAWEEEVVFAEDRIGTLCGLLGTVPLCTREDFPEGWEALLPKGGEGETSR